MRTAAAAPALATLLMLAVSSTGSGGVQAAVIAGRVAAADTGIGLSGVPIEVRGYATWNIEATTSTGIDGTYAVTGLAPGWYYVRTTLGNASEYLDEVYDGTPCLERCQQAFKVPVIVAAGETRAGVDLALSRGAWISGRIRDAATGAGIPSFIAVSIVSSSGNTFASLWIQENYEVALPPGTYFAQVTDTEPNYLGELHDDIPCPLSSCLPTKGTPITVTAGSPLTIDFHLSLGGMIAGTVTDAATGAPLGPPLFSGRVCAYTATGIQVRCANSDQTGAYVLTRLPTGIFHVATDSYVGYVDEVYDDIPNELPGPPVTSGARITVAAGTTRAGVDFTLTRQRTGRVAGQVASPGRILSGTRVVFYTSSGALVHEESVYQNPFVPGPATYSASLPYGTYFIATRVFDESDLVDELHADMPCVGCPVTTGTPIMVSEVPITVNFDLSAGGGVITGVVTDAATGTAIGGVNVEVYASSGRLVKTVMSLGTGEYTVAGLTTGTYYARTRNGPESHYLDRLYSDLRCDDCTVTTGIPIAVTSGTTVRRVDFALRPGGNITGSVTSLGLPVSADVKVFEATGTQVRSSPVDANGNFTVRGLRSGTYYAVAAANADYVDELYLDVPCINCQATSGTAIPVAEGTTRAGVDFDLSPGARVSGRITDADTGHGLAGVNVRIHAQDGRLLRECRWGQLRSHCTLTATNGTYTLDGLPAGTYYLRTGAGPNYVDEVFHNVPCVECAVATGTPVIVAAAGARNDVDFALSSLSIPATLSTTPIVAGRRLTLSFGTAAAERWIALNAVEERSYCAQLTPAPAAVRAGTPVLAAFARAGETVLGRASGPSARTRLIVPATETLLFQVRQLDAGARTYQLTVMETTLWSNWFFTGGDYSSYTTLRNTTATSVEARITWRTLAGQITGTRTVVIAAHGLAYYDARTESPSAGAGSVEVAHNGPPQALVGSQTTLSATGGLSFDTILRPRRPW